ncbi:DUF6056 family protein [Pontibacter sp. HSC-36F09]|uniref:DUF6056 family protein n=1 Tax=Pontibacter sp. HSC-36F09 TaxID=2910966 RepID=UPI00209F1E3B|nr:DUF6056 family protein [Pontibacter sp. HSC-36F09]
MSQASQHNSHSHGRVLLILLGICSILPFLILSLYAHPTADDFSFAIRDTTLNFYQSQVEFYMNWSGRYFGTAIVRINPLTIGSLKLYKFYSFLTILFLILQVYFLTHLITNNNAGKLKAASLTAILVSLYLLVNPSPAEGFYFFTTYAAYQFPNTLVLLMLCILYAFFETDSVVVKKTFIGITSLLCIAIVGSNEMSMIVTFSTLFLILVANWKNQNARPYLLFLFIICVASCSVSVLAPGNYARMNDHPNASRFWWSTIYSVFLTLLTFYRWLAPVLVASVLYMLYIGLPLAGSAKNHRLFTVDLRLASLYFLGTIFLMYFVFAWSTGERATPRVENVICFFFIFGWFYLLQIVITTYGHMLKHERLLTPFIPTAAFLLFALNIFSIESNVTTAYVDLISGKAAAYDKTLNLRYSSLKASDCEVCPVPPLPTIPKTIYFSDILEGSKNNDMWINRGFADYWRKEAVYLTEPNPPVQNNLTTLRETGKSSLREKSLIE